MKKRFAEIIYKILQPFIVIQTYKSVITLMPVIEVWIFGEKVAVIEYSERELIFKVI